MLAKSAQVRGAACLWLLFHAALYATAWLGRVPRTRRRQLAFRLAWLAGSAALTCDLVWAPPAVRACSQVLFGCGGGRGCAARLLRTLVRGGA
ncbi:hypothetical protein T492DRAFT_248485 [Pavlovales sp. CCMP2436]|nr:hypothetical protein T492DRAFT_248485 [Pavlovales sp. CCMP2436]